MTTSKRNDTENYIERQIASWFNFLNAAIGTVSFGLALGALGTKSSQFYAWLGVILITLIYAPQYQKRKRFLRLLREENHPSLSYSNILYGAGVFCFGTGFLFLVAFGFLQSDITCGKFYSLIQIVQPTGKE